MNVLLSFAGAGLTVSFLHAILPNHWLPFVLAGRAQRWSLPKTLWIVTLAGGGHVLITTLLGVIIVWTGLKVTGLVEEWSGVLAGGVLVLFGAYYVIRHFRGGGHGHHHLFGGHHHGERHEHHDHSHDHPHVRAHGETEHAHSREEHDHSDSPHDHDHDDHGGHSRGERAAERAHTHKAHGGKPGADAVAVGSLIAMLTFSPCEGFLPVYLTAWPHGWTAFAVLSIVLAIGTLAGMLVFTALTYKGVQKIEFPALEKYEGLILGGILLLMGVGVMMLHDHV